MDQPDTTPDPIGLQQLPSGDLVNTTTGEAFDPDDQQQVLAVVGSLFDTYADTADRLTACQARVSDIRAQYAKAAEEAMLKSEAYLAAVAAARDAEEFMTYIRLDLEAAFPGRTGDTKVSLDTGRVLATWGVKTKTWSLREPASYYATRKAEEELCNVLVGASTKDLLGVARDVLSWLRPRAKVGTLPPVRLTVRPPKAG